MESRYYAVEGIDRIGKTTLLKAIEESINFVRIVDSMKSPKIFPKLKHYAIDQETPEELKLVLYSVGHQLMLKQIKKNNRRGYMSISDRSPISGLAYHIFRTHPAMDITKDALLKILKEHFPTNVLPAKVVFLYKNLTISSGFGEAEDVNDSMSLNRRKLLQSIFSKVITELYDNKDVVFVCADNDPKTVLDQAINKFIRFKHPYSDFETQYLNEWTSGSSPKK